MMKNKEIPFKFALKEWVWTQKEIQRILRMVSRPYLHAKYEDLCNHPSETLNRVYNYVGIEELGWNGKFVPPNSHILGNRMRLTFNGKLELDYKWKRILTLKQQVEFEQTAGYLNNFLGYNQ